jgi:putative nucleotidyltransferase with HDIG domain
MDENLNFYDLISSVYPDLIERLKKHILENEAEFSGHSAETQESFLWDHTVQVASVALKLAVLERTDPLIPVITALFHDSGKFRQGDYHAEEIPEEEHAATAAAEMLGAVGMAAEQVQMTVQSLNALYQENISKTTATNIVHDADFLVKFGFLGAANFFMKTAIRGKPLQTSVLNYLSKELTYASHLPENMRTHSAKKLAKKKKRDSLTFFYGLLDELREADIACYTVKKLKIPQMKRKSAFLEIYLVIPDKCTTCKGEFTKEWATEKGIKCEKLNVDVFCKECKCHYDFSFCLPEIPVSEHPLG